MAAAAHLVFADVGCGAVGREARDVAGCVDGADDGVCLEDLAGDGVGDHLDLLVAVHVEDGAVCDDRLVRVGLVAGEDDAVGGPDLDIAVELVVGDAEQVIAVRGSVRPVAPG